MPALYAALERLYFSASRIRRRAAQLLCREFGLARTRNRISTLFADGSGVFKTRSVKRHPPSRQADLALLQSMQSVSARPWDPTGSKAEADTFVFPQAKRSEEATAVDPSNFEEQQQQSTEPLAPEDLQEVEDLLGDDLSGFEPEAFPPRDDLSDLESLTTPPDLDENFEPPHITLDQQTQGQPRSASEAALPHPAARRPRLEEASASSPTKRTSETLPVGTSKVQRMASVTFAESKNRFRVCVCVTFVCVCV